MNLPHYFIRRPIFAVVLSIVTILLGILAYESLPVSQFPDAVPPTIVVTATYPGATAETVAATVAAPIEQEINGVEDMLYMSSVSGNDGSVKITVTFKLGTDLDKAQVLTQNRVRVAEARLPQEVQRTGVTTKKTAPDILMVNFVYSPGQKRDQLYISNYAILQMKDTLARVEGVGDITVFGAREYSMRVWLDPDRLQSLNLTAGEVVSALQQQNVQVAAGSLAQPPTQLGRETQVVLNTQGRFEEPEQFKRVVIRSSPDGRLVRVGDVARVELGALNYVTNSYFMGEPAVAMLIFQRPGANALATARALNKTLEELKKDYPEGIESNVGYNPTTFIDDSFAAVQETIIEAVVLVVLVVIVFLQNLRAAIIPLLTIPVSIIGTFAIMSGLGFSLNSLSLFGLVLAIGIVVDDAIVVVENVERHIARGLKPREASFVAMDEVAGPVIAIAVVLCAVFVPTAFISGISGSFYKQFALTIAGATIISAFNSLTLTPAMCAVLLKPHGTREGWFARVWNLALGWFFRLFNKTFDASSNAYAAILRRSARLAVVVVLIYAGLLVLTGQMFRSVPTGFVPASDQGYLIMALQLPDGSSLERTDALVRKVIARVKDVPGAMKTIGFAGLSGATQTNATNAGVVYSSFQPFSERDKTGRDLKAMMADVQARLADIKEASVFVIPPPTVPGLGSLGGFTYEVQDRSGRGSAALAALAADLSAAANGDKRLAGVYTQFRASSPQLYADIDRTRAEMLNVPTSRVLDALQVNIGSQYVNDFNVFGRPFRVTAAADAKHRLDPSDIAKLRARSDKGAMVPLGSLTTFKQVTGPEFVTRYNLYPSAEVYGDTGPGGSSSQAIEAMEAAAHKTLPQGYGATWTGLYYQQILAGNTSLYVFPLCVLFVFLALAALYESWSLPLVIILIVPMCLLCAIVGVWLRGMDNNVLTQIGFVVLVGLACKNAILIVEFAKEEQDKHGKDAVSAAVEAGRVRLRPILMTSFAFILGVLPLVTSHGAGFELRRALGTAVFSGMLGVTFFGLIFTPVFYVVVRWLTSFRWKESTPAIRVIHEH
ncbi:MAG: multidrug efflux RND transporter permease subunit [Tepidisphaeraceae bacterium]